MAAVPLIAIIDDDLSLQKALVRLIRSLGYQARGFASAEEFLQSATITDCSCVITDLHMPGLSGIELMDELDERQRRVPVILITARTEAGIAQRALASGALCFLKKPIDTNVLVEWIARALKPS